MNNPARRRTQRLRRLPVPTAGSAAAAASAAVAAETAPAADPTESPDAPQFQVINGTAELANARLTLLIDPAGRIHAVQDACAAGLINCSLKTMFGSSVTRWLRWPAVPGAEQAAGVVVSPPPGVTGSLVAELLAAAAAGPLARPLECEWLCDQLAGSVPVRVAVRAERVQSEGGLRCLLHIQPHVAASAGTDDAKHDDASPQPFSDDEDERLAVTLDSITDAVITTDAQGRVTYLNVAAEQLIGCPSAEVVGALVEEIYRRASAQPRRQIDNPVRAVLQTGLRVSPRDAAHLAGDPATGNPPRVIADNAAPITDFGPEGRLTGVVLVFHDITDRHRANEELQKAGRIESLGLLAGGIAHDFNNLLTSVLGNLSVARSSGGGQPFFANPAEALDWARNHPPLPAAVIEAIDRAERACSRARELTNQLLTFAKGGDPVRKTVELPAPIEQAVHFALTGSNVRADCQFDPDLATVEADEGQVVQIFHNLALNAAQAMSESGGTLEVRAANARGFPGSASPPLPPGDYVVVTVRDTGCGIPPEHMAKIFDPFFTTKANGTGLGLATTYSIVKKHDGAVKLESEPGVGTTFTIFLPANASSSAAVASPDAPAAPTDRPAPGLRVLFMDDDADIRELIGAILALLGYEVTLTSDGAAAIAEYEGARAVNHPFAAVILDLTIPGGMGGKETVRRLREIDPEVRAIVSSGYSNDAVVSDFKHAGFVGMVAKPYKMEDLARVLHEVIKAR